MLEQKTKVFHNNRAFSNQGIMQDIIDKTCGRESKNTYT